MNKSSQIIMGARIKIDLCTNDLVFNYDRYKLIYLVCVYLVTMMIIFNIRV